jgi:type IV secretory pathway protease TraF
LTLHAVEHAVQLKRVEVRRDQFLARSDLDYELVDFRTVPEDGYFVLGDNLPVSIDSRHELGCVSRSQIIGVIEAEVPRP